LEEIFAAQVRSTIEGMVAGSSSLAGDQTTHPFLWQHGKMTDLGTLGGLNALGEWLNDAGDVIGISGTRDGSPHGFVWRRGVLIDLGTVGSDNSSHAFGINARGQVVGQSWFFGGHNTTASHAFLWEHSGPMIDLNTLVTNPSEIYLTEANFITDRGWIVANGPLPNGDVHTAILIPEDDAAAE
jgi:probable HAF family extracellular repeat protein